MKRIVSFVRLDRLRLFCIVSLFIGVARPALSQISGKVFRDFDGNGRLSSSTPTLVKARSSSEPVELGVPNVTVRAYVELSTSPISTTTTADGSYSFTAGQIAPGQRVRLEFANLERGYYPSAHNPNGGGTTVQFVTAPATNIDAGINYPSDYCQPGYIQVTIPCFVNGDPAKTQENDGTPIDIGQQAGTMDALVGFDYNAYTVKDPNTNGAANASQFPPAHLATARQVGSIWGLAIQRRTKQLFSAAVVKRHAGFGPLGSGGIYITDLNNSNPNATTPFLSFSVDLGISTGDIPNRDLRGNKLFPNADPGPMEAMGRVGFGGADMSEDDRTLYVMNLFDRKLYGLTVGVPAQKPSSTTGVKSWVLTGPGCPQGEFRPWAVKYYRGNVYVGGVCSGEYVSTPVANPATMPAAAASNTVLSGHIYRIDPSVSGTTPELILSFPLSFTRGSADLTGECANYKFWLPWTNTFPETCVNNFVMWPQPMLTDLEFDVDGHMVIGMLDRFGHLAGVANHAPDGSGFYDGFTGGDLLRAAPSGAKFVMESNGTVGSLTSANGVNDGQGPGGGEFYSDDAWIFYGKPAHDEINNGALALIPGKNEVISSAYDPVTDIYKSAGWKAHNNTNGIGERGFVIVVDNPGTFGKASGLGDAKPICDPAPVEIGNRFWFDDNRNGIQDAYEPGVDGIVIRLYENNSFVASTTTTNGGQWYFNNSNVLGGIKFGGRYQTRMDMGQLANYNLAATGPAAISGARTQTKTGRLAAREYSLSPIQVTSGEGQTVRDSDASMVGNEAVINVVVGEPGQNDQNYDFSVKSCPVLESTTSNLTVCSGQVVGDITIKGFYFAVPDKVKFVLFDTPQTNPTVIYSSTNVLGTVTPSSSSTTADGGILVTLPRPSIPTNTGATVPTFKYVYAVVEAASPLSVSCQPYDDIIITILPKPLLTVTSATLTCAKTSATLTAFLTNQQQQPIANGIYRWTGPNNFTSNAQNPVVTQEGTYTVSAASPECPNSFTTAVATVTSFTTAPEIIDAYGDVPLCSTCTATISVTYTPETATVLWRGPNNYTSTEATNIVSTPGFYTAIVTSVEGCTAEVEVEVPPVQEDVTASLGDYVFYDRDNNGVQGGTSETGVIGVTVELYAQGNNTPIRSTTTNATGFYSFTGLATGCYQVKFLTNTYPTDFVGTTALVGSDRTADSDADPQTGLTPVVCLSAGEANLTIDAGLVEKSLLVVFNSICIKDTPYLSYTITPVNFTPTSVSAATITIRKFMDNSLVVVKTNQALTGTFLWPGAVVDAQGNPIDWPGWDFVNGEWIQVNDGLRPYLKFEVAVNPVASTTANYPGPQPACIPGPPLGLGDRVWKDLNGNGIQDTGEPGVSNFAVELYTVTNGVRSTSALSTTTTDGTGYYLFSNLPEGSYQVRFLPSSVPADCLITAQFAGSDRSNDSNANPVSGYSDVITLSYTDLVRPNRTIDCGLKPCPGEICIPIQARRVR